MPAPKLMIMVFPVEVLAIKFSGFKLRALLDPKAPLASVLAVNVLLTGIEIFTLEAVLAKVTVALMLPAKVTTLPTRE